MTDAENRLIRQHVRSLTAYEPIVPFEVLSAQLGRPAEALVKLDANENPYGPAAAVREVLATLPYVAVYPDPEARALRAALAQDTGVPARNLIAGAGSDELIDLVMRLCLDPGDAVINCPPTFGMYAFDAAVQAADVISVPRGADFSLDLDAIERVVATRRPKLLFLASPNNPDGSQVAAQALQRLLALPLLVVLDEAYIEFASSGGHDQSYIREVTTRENLIVLRTFSKWAGLAGLRVGYGAFPGSLVPELWKIKQPYTVSVAAAAAAIASLAHRAELEQTVALLVRERERLYTALQKLPGLQPYPSAANFILCRVPGDGRAAVIKAALAQQGILVRYFSTPALQDCIRISVGRPEQTDALLAALSALVESVEEK